MRVAVLSDIHGNLHALEAVLAAADAADVDEVWCLGDVVGYGARPERVLRAGARACGRLPRREPRPRRGRNARARGVQPRRGRCRGLVARLTSPRRTAPTSPGSRPAPSVTAFCSPTAARGTRSGSTSSATTSRSRRSRRPRRRSSSSGTATSRSTSASSTATSRAGSPRPARSVELARRRWLLNPGSVGQPRDGDPRAAWLLLDLGAHRATFERTDYDIASTQAEIREAGLPELLALRLASGS